MGIINQHRIVLAAARKSFYQLHARTQEAYLDEASHALFGMSFDQAKSTAEGDLLDQVFAEVPLKAVQLHNEWLEQVG